MSKRTRQYIGILAAVIAYYLVHEGAHLLYALFTGVFRQVKFMGLGVQVDVFRERMTDMQLGIEDLSRACRYADCTHTSEPGCAVLRALADGTLDAARLASYRKLKTENDYAADNSRYLEAKRTKFKEIAKINKSNRKR